MKFINLIRRACLRFVIWSLEIHLADQNQALRTAVSSKEFSAILTAKTDTQDELARVRKEYSALLPVGIIKKWGIA